MLRISWVVFFDLHSAEGSHLYRWRDECSFFPVQQVFKRPLNEDKASSGCHRF